MPVKNHTKRMTLLRNEFVMDGIRLSLIAVTYLIIARLNLAFVIRPEGIAPVWPPSGLFLAVLLLSRRRKWPATVIVLYFTDLAAEILAGSPLLISLTYAAVLCAEATLGAWLLTRFLGTPITFGALREPLGLLGFSVLLSNTLTSLIAAATPTVLLGSSFFEAWKWWWISDGVGILLITPAILTWASSWDRIIKGMAPGRIIEVSVLFFTMTIIAHLIFGARPDSGAFAFFSPYLTFPSLVWAALRFGPCGSATASLVLSVVATGNTIQGYGPMAAANSSHQDYLIGLQLYLAVMSFTSLILASVVAERSHAAEALRQSERRFSLFMRYLPGFAFMKDSQGRFTYINERHEAYFGPNTRDWLGKTSDQIWPAELAEKTRRDDELVLSRGELVEIVEQFPLKGESRTYLIHKFPIPGFSQSAALGGISIDITELKKAESEIREYSKDLEAINAILSNTTTGMNLQSILARFLQGALKLTGQEGGTLCLVEQEKGILTLAASQNASAEMVKDLSAGEIKIGDCLCGHVAETGEPLILWDNASGSEYATLEAVRNEGIRFHAAFPLLVKDRTIGVLCIFARSGIKPTERSLDLVRGICGPIALAIENARLFDETTHHAATLEERVAERTAELKRMVGLMAGREVRMAELKEEIRELRERARKIEVLGLEP